MFQSKGAYKEYQARLSKAREHATFKGTHKEYQVRLSKARSTICIETLLMVPQLSLAMDARDRMENVLEYIISITMEINFSSEVYSKSLLKVCLAVYRFWKTIIIIHCQSKLM